MDAGLALGGLPPVAELKEPDGPWSIIPTIDFQDQYYYARPKRWKKNPNPWMTSILSFWKPIKTGNSAERAGSLAGVEAPEGERRVAVDAVFDSVSVGTTFQAELRKAGVIFCSISEAIREHPELVRKYLGSVVPVSDNYYATLNSAVFSDGSFVYIPPGVRCPMELSTYFRINAENTGPI